MVGSGPTTEANKATVRRFFELASTKGLQEALMLVADDAEWWMPGGDRTKRQIASIVALVEAELDTPVAFRVEALTAEENRVAAEVKGDAVRRNGKVYANTYHFLFRVVDGVIVSVHEHFDTQHAFDTWVDLLPQFEAKLSH